MAVYQPIPSFFSYASGFFGGPPNRTNHAQSPRGLFFCGKNIKFLKKGLDFLFFMCYTVMAKVYYCGSMLF